MQDLTPNHHDADTPEHDPNNEAYLVDSFPIFLWGGRLCVLLNESPAGLNQNQDNIDDRCAQDCAQGNNETDFSKRISGVEPSDADQMRRLPDTDQGNH